MDQAYLSRVVLRIAHQILESTFGNRNIVLLGINQRGQFVAEQIATAISSLVETDIPMYAITVDYKTSEIQMEALEQGFNLNEQHLVVVDDVIFSGTTMFAALNHLISNYEFISIKTAALVDRGHRKVPVHCDFCGLYYPTKLDEQVFARVGDDQEGEEAEVVLLHSPYKAEELKR